MKKFLALIFAVITCVTCAALAACKNKGSTADIIDSITITAPASTEIKAGEKFTLGYTVLPAEKADEVTVDWEISDNAKLSHVNGEFTALTCGNVNVKATVRGSNKTDEINIKVIAPDGYAHYSGSGYSLVYPTPFWQYSSEGGIDTWTETVYNEDGSSGNMNVISEPLNTAVFAVPAQYFQQMIEANYELLGFDVTFDQPVTAQKTTYLGVQRLQIEYLYTLKMGYQSISIHQTQVVFNNTKTNSTYTLTISFTAAYYNENRVQTIINQFMPA